MNSFIAPCGHPGRPIIGTYVMCPTCDLAPKAVVTMAHIPPQVLGLRAYLYPNPDTYPSECADMHLSNLNLTQVWPQFARWMLNDPTDGVLQYTTNDHEAELAISVISTELSIKDSVFPVETRFRSIADTALKLRSSRIGNEVANALLTAADAARAMWFTGELACSRASWTLAHAETSHRARLKRGVWQQRARLQFQAILHTALYYTTSSNAKPAQVSP